MLNLLTDYQKPLIINGVEYLSGKQAFEALKSHQGEIVIKLNSKVFRIEVRQYMTKPASKEFDFHDKWNGGSPMPMRIMVGQVLGETKGMVKMRLHGQPDPMGCCVKCGRTLTHPVSILYGIGPECGGHFHINPLETKEELEAAMEDIKAKLAAVQWEGWIIKSAITSIQEMNKE